MKKLLICAFLILNCSAVSGIVLNIPDFTPSGNLTIDSDAEVRTDELTISFGGEEIQGVLVENENFAVFAFNQVVIGPNATINVNGTNGFALLSLADISLSGSLIASTDVYIGFGGVFSNNNGSINVSDSLTIRASLLGIEDEESVVLQPGGSNLIISNPTFGSVINIEFTTQPNPLTVIDSTGSIVAIPEPKTTSLILLGAIGLLGSKIRHLFLA